MADGRKSLEDEYFAREERARREAEEARRRAREREERRRLHFMKCPKCGADLRAESVRGVEVDRCGECRGLWLDAGELEKLAGPEEGLFRSVLETLGVRRYGAGGD